jgi:hypothetical protein
MWIGKSDLTQAYAEKAAEGRRAEREDWEKKCKSFAVYYQERLEYWKEKAKDELRPEPYRIVIFLTNRTQRCREFPDKAAHDAAFSKWTDPKSGAIVLDDGESIERHAVVSIVPDDGDGHPSPYTPAEIEAWAKEKVEVEMQGWRVVKEQMWSGRLIIDDPFCGGITFSGWQKD